MLCISLAIFGLFFFFFFPQPLLGLPIVEASQGFLFHIRTLKLVGSPIPCAESCPLALALLSGVYLLQWSLNKYISYPHGVRP